MTGVQTGLLVDFARVRGLLLSAEGGSESRPPLSHSGASYGHPRGAGGGGRGSQTKAPPLAGVAGQRRSGRAGGTDKRKRRAPWGPPGRVYRELPSRN